MDPSRSKQLEAAKVQLQKQRAVLEEVRETLRQMTYIRGFTTLVQKINEVLDG